MHNLATCFYDNISLFIKLIIFICYIYVITSNILIFYLQNNVQRKKSIKNYNLITEKKKNYLIFYLLERVIFKQNLKKIEGISLSLQGFKKF